MGPEGQPERMSVGDGRHLLPRFFQGIDHLVVRRAPGQSGELMFQKHQAKRILQHAAVRAFGEILLQIEIFHPGNDRLRIAGLGQNFSGLPCMEVLQIIAPAQVTGFRHFIGTPGDHPAAQMLATGGQAKFFGGVRTEFLHPVGESVGIE
jgi:hypothetical protein